VTKQDLADDSSAAAELHDLRVHIAQALVRSMSAGGLATREGWPEDVAVEIEWLGVGSFSDELDPGVSIASDENEGDADIPEELLDGAHWLDGVSVDTGNEYRVRIPPEIMAEVAGQVYAEGGHLGSGTNDGTVAEEGFRSISDGFDGRALWGTVNTAHTGARLRKLFQAGGSTTSGCSGALVGPKHNLSAGHCVWNWTSSNQGNWVGFTLRAGRNGTGWHDTASTSSNTWYWTPSQYRSAGSDPTAGVYDIGMWVTHSDRMGDDPGVDGYLGWWYYDTNTDFEHYYKYNRGYPACGLANPPSNCQQNHMYGDVTGCGIGTYSTSQDPWGIPRRFRFSCDVSQGMSGSPLFEYNTANDAWVVSSVAVGQDGTTGSTPNFGVRITREYSDDIAWLYNTFP
jgi:V8-like Glu-specific endopeptidase